MKLPSPLILKRSCLECCKIPKNPQKIHKIFWELENTTYFLRFKEFLGHESAIRKPSKNLSKFLISTFTKLSVS